MSPWYRRIFPTRLAAHRQAVQEFITTRQRYRLATFTGGVLTGRGADFILIDDPLKLDEALSDAQRKTANDWFSHTRIVRIDSQYVHSEVVKEALRLLCEPEFEEANDEFMKAHRYLRTVRPQGISRYPTI